VPESQTGEERTEPATPKRRQEAREEGRVAQSREVSTVVVLLGGALGLYFLGSWMGHSLAGLSTALLRDLPTGEFTVAGSVGYLTDLAGRTALIVLPFLALMAVVGVSAHALQFGLLWSPKAFMPKAERINPLEGWKRIVSAKGVMEVAKAVFKLCILGFICYHLIRSESMRFAGAMGLNAGGTLELLSSLTVHLVLRCVLALGVLALIDYAFQRWQFEESIKMTRTELKHEMKETEGDPAIRARVRAIQRERSRQRMMERVRDADVVVTNPTEYAVALEYDPETMPAPRVVAKGRRMIAAKIRSIAEEHKVPVVEDPPLARALHAAVDIDDFIPENLYHAVAEVLSYVYQLGGRLVSARPSLEEESHG
jgi:flagellar biosynthetic protein FlhB